MWSPIDSIVTLAVAGCLAIWFWMATRLQRREPVIAYQPRRPVPWHGMDLLTVLTFYLSLQAGVVAIATAIVDREAAHAPDAGGNTTEHVVGQLIAEGNVWVLLLCAPLGGRCRAGGRRVLLSRAAARLARSPATPLATAHSDAAATVAKRHWANRAHVHRVCDDAFSGWVASD